MRRSLSAPAGRGPVHAGRRGSFAPAGVARVRPARAPRPAGADHRQPNERATRLLHTRIPSGHYGGGRRTQLRHRADSRCCLEDLQKMGRIAASRRQTREPGPHRADGPLHQCLLAFSVQSAGLCFRAPRYRRWDRVPRAPMSGGRLFPSAQRRISAWARGVIWITRLPSCGEANSGAPRHSLKGTTAAISTSRPFVDRGFFTQRAGSRRGSRSIHLNPRCSLQGACWQGSLTSHAVRDLRKRGAR